MIRIDINNDNFPSLYIKEDMKTLQKKISRSRWGIHLILLHDATGIPFMVRPKDITFVEGEKI